MLAPVLFFVAVATAKIIHSLPSIPPGWRFVRDAAPSDPISLKISLQQQHVDELEQVVLEVSTPGHSNYGMHLTRNQLRSFTAPSTAAVRAVSIWLQQYRVTPSIDNDWVSIATTVHTADELLNTRFAWYQYDKSSLPVLRTLSYSVPDELAGHIDLVQPTTRFGQLGSRRSTIFDLHHVPDAEAKSLVMATSTGTLAVNSMYGGCSLLGITPACLQSIYNINYTVTKPLRNRVAFASYLEEYARYKDLTSFETNLLPTAIGQNFSVIRINKGLNDQDSTDDSGEANLDIQYILGVSHPIPIVEYSTGGLGPLVPTPTEPTQPGGNEPCLEFLTHLIASDDDVLPQTLSTSYGEEEQSVPEEYALKVCNLFMQLGARGVSVLFSSGDSGPGDICVRVSDNKSFFQPTFPAGCPYVTAVGATYQTGPEIAVSFSSGGFSSLHPRPVWQDTVVNTYLDSIGDTYASFFNASNRGFPDVAAQGSNFLVYDQGRLSRLSGTSASSPVFAGVVALLNAARRSKLLPPLGFLNPWLYNNSAALTDITAGAGMGCTDTAYFQSPAYWNATHGWDPVTGLGTPDFPALLSAAAPGVANI